MARGLEESLPCPEGCRYQVKDGSCNYLNHDEGRSARGCPPGPDCIRYEPAEGYRAKPVRPPQPKPEPKGYVKRPTAAESLEKDPEVLAMYRDGATDQEIADATGWSRRTIAKWRLSNGLPGHRRGVSLLAREEDAARMYGEGLNDNAIARAIGCTPVAVFYWRTRTGRPPNGQPGRPRKETNQ